MTTNRLVLRWWATCVIHFILPPVLICACASGARAETESAKLKSDLNGIEGGSWAVSRTILIPAMPLPPRPKQGTACVDKGKGEDVLTLTVFGNDDLYKNNCKVARETRDAQSDIVHLTLELACSPQFLTKGTVDITITNAKRVKAVSTFWKQPDTPWMIYTEESSWVGACGS